MTAWRTTTRVIAIACDSLSRQQRSICQVTFASLRALHFSEAAAFERGVLTSRDRDLTRQQARGFAAGPEHPTSNEALEPMASSVEPPSQPTPDSFQAVAELSSSNSDGEIAEDDEDDAETVDYIHDDEDNEQEALVSAPQTVKTEQDEMLEKIQSSSKKHQRHLLQQLLKGNELSGSPDTLGQEEGIAAIAAARQKYSLKLVDVNSTNKGSPAGGIQSFSAMVVVGDHEGLLGHGTGKAAELVAAIRKASLRALNNLTYIPRYERFTILHPVDTKFGKCKLRMYPLTSGGGIRANNLLGDVAALAGINSIGIKTHCSRNARNSVKALFKAFGQLTTIEQQAKDKGMAAYEVIVGSRPKPKQRFKYASRLS